MTENQRVEKIATALRATLAVARSESYFDGLNALTVVLIEIVTQREALSMGEAYEWISTVMSDQARECLASEYSASRCLVQQALASAGVKRNQNRGKETTS